MSERPLSLTEKLDLVEEAFFTFGIEAARELHQKLGLPTPPSETWSSMEDLEAQRRELLRRQ